jgi:hypothetical protein
MKPIAIFVLVAAVSVAAIATSAKNATAPGNADERMIAGVAGAAAETSQRRIALKGEQPGKAEPKKTKIQPKPPDPN